MATLLLEIGAEEIPAGYIQPALSALADNLSRRLSDARVDFGTVKTMGTPRRLTLLMSDVALRQKSVTTEVMGPPAKVAFDDRGKPTVAARKFAEKVGVAVSALKKIKTSKGEYIGARKTDRGVATKTLLKDVLPQVILATPFPKTMRWAELSIAFARPIHSIVALLDNQLITFNVEALKSGRYTQGHSFMAPKKIKLGQADQYTAMLRKQYVIADIAERQKFVEREIKQSAKRLKGKVLPDAELVETVTNLVEYPFATAGRFDKEFLELPDEILITSMREHQKYFAVVDSDGKLMNGFIAVNNTRTKDMDLVATGHERVLRARLADGQFFYRADMEVPFDTWVEKLKGVLFQAQLGSMYAKMERVQKLSAYLADAISAGASKRKAPKYLKKYAMRAAQLCKADLVSQVVVEFPRLQGVMGRVYATRKGEPRMVAQAIEEHYRPTYSGGPLPKSLVGAVVSIADKLDSICGCFRIGLKPTGASDPYALRRQGIGIVQIMQQHGLAFSLRDAIKKSIRLFGKQNAKEVNAVCDDVYTFLGNRLAHMLSEEGYTKDVIGAVTSITIDHVPHVGQRVKALQAFKARPDFESLAVGFKRAVNIIRKSGQPGRKTKPGKVNRALFEHKAERDLLSAYTRVAQKVAKLLPKGQFDKALKEIAALRGPIDAFFDAVMVMADNKKIRRNRLAMLQHIAGLFAEIADFAKIST